MSFNELGYHPFQPPKLFPAPVLGVNEELNPFNGTPPPTDRGSKVLQFCLCDFSSILKVQAILRTTSAILNYVNLIILTYSLQAQNSTSTANDDSDYSFLSKFFSPFFFFFWKQTISQPSVLPFWQLWFIQPDITDFCIWMMNQGVGWPNLFHWGI